MTDFQSIIDKIMPLLPDTKESFVSDVLKRIESLGYTPADTDAQIIAFAIQTTKMEIKNECNITSIPEALHYVAIDMVCGDFLYNMKQTGQLDHSDLNLDQALSSVSMGDVNVSFAKDDESDKLNTLISHLSNSGKGALASYRKIKW